MRWLLCAALLLGQAQASTWYGRSDGRLIESAAQTGYTWVANVPDAGFPEPGSSIANSDPLTNPVRIQASQVTMTSTTFSSTSSSQTVIMYFGWRDAGNVYHNLCNASIAITSSTDGSKNFLCTPPQTDVPAGARFEIQGFTPAAGLASITLSTPSVSITTACTTAAQPCACGGLCGGSTCGAQYTTGSSDHNRCGCDCNVSGCISTLQVPAPTFFVCTEQNNGKDVRCQWVGNVGSDNSTLLRGSTEIYHDVLPAFTDSPGPGIHTYNVFNTGSCPSNMAQGNPLPSKNSLTATTTAPVRSKGTVAGVW